MSFPRYAKYRDSGVEWLGDVPDHWKVGKCGFYLRIISGFAFPSADFSENESDTKLLRGINVGISHLNWDETVYWPHSPGDGLDIYEMQAGDLVIGMDRPLISEGIRVAKVKESDLPCLLLQRVASLKTDNSLNPDYLFGLLSSEMFVAHFSPDTTGVSVPHISPEQINNFVIPLPPFAEQNDIVTFILAETAKIDALVREQRRLIELLKEKRQAVISHAVTKGLNPHARMKPSGIEWLGDVPEHWEATKVGYVASVTRGTGYQNVEEADEADDAIQMIRISDFNDFNPVWVRNSSTLDGYKVDSTDLLIAGTGASAGITMQVTNEMAGMMHSYNAPRIRCSHIEPEFLYFVLNSQSIQYQEDLLFTGSAQHFLDIPSISKLELYYCERTEQRRIVRYLNEELGKLDTLTAEAQRAIDLLQERRTALISAAVTGKIDVRGLAESEAA